jgi:hypothetical protein
LIGIRNKIIKNIVPLLCNIHIWDILFARRLRKLDVLFGFEKFLQERGKKIADLKELICHLICRRRCCDHHHHPSLLFLLLFLRLKYDISSYFSFMVHVLKCIKSKLKYRCLIN